MAYNAELADRVREALADKPSVREVKMFGGLSFMVNEKMVVSVQTDGGLLVRVDPEQNDALVTKEGAQQAEMGAGRVMGDGWISVAEEAIASDDDFDYWLQVALDFNAKDGGPKSKRKSKGRR